MWRRSGNRKNGVNEEKTEGQGVWSAEPYQDHSLRCGENIHSCQTLQMCAWLVEVFSENHEAVHWDLVHVRRGKQNPGLNIKIITLACF